MDFFSLHRRCIGVLATLQFYALLMERMKNEKQKRRNEKKNWYSGQMGSILRVTVAIVTGMLVEVD